MIEQETLCDPLRLGVFALEFLLLQPITYPTFQYPQPEPVCCVHQRMRRFRGAGFQRQTSLDAAQSIPLRLGRFECEVSPLWVRNTLQICSKPFGVHCVAVSGSGNLWAPKDFGRLAVPKILVHPLSRWQRLVVVFGIE